MSLYKRVNVTEKAYAQLRLEAFNAFNHPQFASANSTIVFNSAGQVINLPSQLGGTGGRFGFGALNATRANSGAYSSRSRRSFISEQCVSRIGRWRNWRCGSGIETYE